MLHIAEPFLEQNLHPTVIVRGFMRALEDAIATVDSLSFPIDTSNREQMLKTVQSCIGTKYTARFGTLMAVCTAPLILWLLNIHRGRCKQIADHGSSTINRRSSRWTR